jgi:hypothetical protein
MAAVGVTLTDAQMRPLTAALVAEQSRMSSEIWKQFFNGGTGAQDPVQQRQARYKLQGESNVRIIEAMKPYLSGQQLEVLRTELERRRTRMKPGG